MALTTQEEDKVRLLLEAMDGAKSIGDLPTADSATLLTALMEVVQGGVSKKTTVEDVMDLFGEKAAYGIKINISTGVVTRVGNATLHRTLPIQVGKIDVGLKAIPRLRLIEDGSLRLSTYGLRFLR